MTRSLGRGVTRGDPIRGLPGMLPEGETILWQGAPCWRALARRMYHVDAVGLYFAVLIAGTFAAQLVHGVPFGPAMRNEAPVVATAAATVGILGLLAWLTARTTEYTITSARVVMRFGIALSAVLAIPYARITRVAVQVQRDHTGDIPLRLVPGSGIGALRVWPHMRPWHLRTPEPMLRGVRQAAVVGTVLSRAVAQANGSGADAYFGASAAARPAAA